MDRAVKVAEYCAHDPKRLYGVGLVSLEDPEAAVADLEAIAKLGMRGAMIWGAAPDDRPYGHPRYEPFWAAAADLEHEDDDGDLRAQLCDGDPRGAPRRPEPAALLASLTLFFTGAAQPQEPACRTFCEISIQ